MNFALNHYFFNPRYRWHHLGIIVLTAFIIRALTFGFYVQHEQRYKQADTNDYHFCAVGMKAGTGMHRIDNGQPIFWRTPGYPLYLSLFYKWFDIKTSDFTTNSEPIKASIWLQILLCSFIPLLVFFLSLSLTNNIITSWIAAWMSVFHIGFILASCYILSDALAHILFLGFLYFFYQSFTLWFEQHRKKQSNYIVFRNIIVAALLLGLYTWIRPNGQFTVVLSVIILLLGKCTWKIKLTKTLLFASIFFALIGGWYVRNYQLTNHIFFCPMSGPYLQSFSVPKIMRRVVKRPLEDCIKYLMSIMHNQINEETARLAQEAPHLKVSKELLCSKIAMPWIKKYPGYFMYDWMKEVIKTTFDLYGYQLVAMVNKTHTYDPLEEFLTEKIAACLFNQPMPLLMRILCWLELFFSLWLWIGLLCGSWAFFLKPLFYKSHRTHAILNNQALWLKTGLFIGGMLFMTGGFGYARLRMPVDPLLFILSLTFWSYYMSRSNFSFAHSIAIIMPGNRAVSTRKSA
jgi:hypothetical protein